MTGSATRTRSPLVFLSHSSIDAVEVERVAQEFENHGVTVWLAKHDMHSGSTYAAEITEQIEVCDAFCLLLSSNSLASKHVAREMNLALDTDRLVIPVTRQAELLNPKLLPPEWRYWLGTVQIAVLSSDLNELGAIAADLGGVAEPERTGLTTSAPNSKVSPRSRAQPDQPQRARLQRPPSASGAERVQNQVKSMVIRSGLHGVAMSEILQQSRRLHIDAAVVRESVLALRDANLITFAGDLENDTAIRLT